jgi:hypothetical protein
LALNEALEVDDTTAQWLIRVVFLEHSAFHCYPGGDGNDIADLTGLPAFAE